MTDFTNINIALKALKQGANDLPDEINADNEGDVKKKLEEIANSITAAIGDSAASKDGAAYPPQPPTTTEELPPGWVRKTGQDGTTQYYENKDKATHFWIKHKDSEGNEYYYASDEPETTVWSLNDVTKGGNKKRNPGKSKRRYKKRRRGKSSRRRRR